MTIYIGSDHRGFELKGQLIEWLKANSYSVVDCGNTRHDPQDDYPDFAFPTAESVAKNSDSLGVVLCGSGVGVSVAANKIKGIICGLIASSKQIESAKGDDNCNMIALPVDFVTQEEAIHIVKTFIETPFSQGERHVRRLAKIQSKEAQLYK